MGVTVRASSRIRTTTVGTAHRGKAIFCCAALMALCILLLCVRLGFARYAFTFFLWQSAEGTVMNSRSTTDPSIQFAAVDGSLHAFSEDYFLLCGHRSLCYRRSFSPGEVVPIVYDPGTPERAYVHDWALYVTIFEWFVEAFFLLLFALLFWNLIRGGSVSRSIEFSTSSSDE